MCQQQLQLKTCRPSNFDAGLDSGFFPDFLHQSKEHVPESGGLYDNVLVVAKHADFLEAAPIQTDGWPCDFEVWWNALCQLVDTTAGVNTRNCWHALQA